MTDIKVSTRFQISRMLNVFGAPNSPNPDIFLDEFAKAISGFSAETLEKAVDRILKTSKFWPKPAEVREAAGYILEEQASRNLHIKALDARERGWKQPSEEERGRVRAMLSDLNARLNSVGGYEIDFSAAEKSQRPDFEEMQRNSFNAHLHTRKLDKRY